MNTPLRVAVVGLGRIGCFHAQHVLEIANQQQRAQLVAVVDSDRDRCELLLRRLGPTKQQIRAYSSVAELIDEQIADAAIIATATESHYATARPLIDAGFRVLLEKPMTASLAGDREFADYLNGQAPAALMLAFQRRFDEPLGYAKQLLQENQIGRPFKFISILEDSGPLPPGYQSPGLLLDMSVHNIDEVLWLSGEMPCTVVSIGSRLHNHRLSTAIEDFDNASMHLGFDQELVAQIEVSRVHVPGYHVETCIYGTEGVIRVGAYQADRLQVGVELCRRGKPIEHREFRMRNYEADVPEFIHRFGPAYKAEVGDFLDKCQSGEPFLIGQEAGLRAGEIAAAGMAAVNAGGSRPIEFATTSQ